MEVLALMNIDIPPTIILLLVLVPVSNALYLQSFCSSSALFRSLLYKCFFVTYLIVYLSRSNPNRPPVDEQQPSLQLVDKVRQDLEDAPLWPFSCYGIPSVNENLLTGDISMEEIMLEAKRMKFLNQFPAFQQELFSNIQASLGKRNNLPNVVTGNNLPKALIDQQPFQQSSPFHNTQSQLMPSVQAPISSLNPFQPTIAPSFSQSTMAPTLSLPPNNVHVTPQSPFHVNVPFSTEFASFGQGQAFPGPLSGQLPPLTNIQRQAFAAPSFLPGNIPDIPPHL